MFNDNLNTSSSQQEKLEAALTICSLEKLVLLEQAALTKATITTNFAKKYVKRPYNVLPKLLESGLIRKLKETGDYGTNLYHLAPGLTLEMIVKHKVQQGNVEDILITNSEEKNKDNKFIINNNITEIETDGELEQNDKINLNESGEKIEEIDTKYLALLEKQARLIFSHVAEVVSNPTFNTESKLMEILNEIHQHIDTIKKLKK